MADSKILQPFILSWEGGFANHPQDPGGATMKGVTLQTFKGVFGASKTVEDLKRITDEQWHTIYKKYYWDRWKADQIYSQSIANLVVDWVWGSGAHGITKVQELLGVKVDGIVGPKTLDALNSKDRLVLFDRIWKRREQFIKSLKTYPTFGRGWMNRLNGIQFGKLVCNGGKTIIFHDER